MAGEDDGQNNLFIEKSVPFEQARSKIAWAEQHA
jgi:hypothetical protein